MKNVKRAFPAIADKLATVLILGSMPGEESLRKKEYYANPRNSFWKIMARLLEFGYDIGYEERTGILMKNRIALWDVMEACERQGSLDSAIVDNTIVENDFVSFYHSHPNIRHVYFNGTKAQNEYNKRVLSKLSDQEGSITYFRFPSTSPAMAKLSFDEKYLEWSSILKRT